MKMKRKVKKIDGNHENDPKMPTVNDPIAQVHQQQPEVFINN
jgi:hypothetical protein